MCVVLCANPKVHEWLDISLARSYRQTLQLCAICPSEPGMTAPVGATLAKPQAGVPKLDKAAEKRVMKRSAWIQAYCRHMAHLAEQRSSPQEWHKTLDVIANAWGRLLSLVGLRW